MRRGAAFTALLLPILLASVARAENVQVTVTYEVWGGASLGYLPLGYEVWGGVSLGYLPLGYPAQAQWEIPRTTVVRYAAEGAVQLERGEPKGYPALAGASLDYTPLVYGLAPSLELGNATFLLRVHVRILEGGEARQPDFDVPYRANGTERVAVRGEDELYVFYQWVALLLRDPVLLEFPETVSGYALLNATPILADPRAVSDVYVYYGPAPPPPSKPPPPRQPSPGEEGEEPPGEEGEESALEREVEKAVGWFYWSALRFLAYVFEVLARLRENPFALFLLLLGLALVALAVYLWRKRGFTLIIEVKG